MEIDLEKYRPGRSGGPGRWTVNALCVLVMMLAFAFLVPTMFGLQRYVITGGSMDGTYDLGSVVFAETVPVEDLRVGDVITYVPPAESGIDNLITHRIVEIDGATFRTQGDANPDVDPWTFELTAANQARVTSSLPYLGFLFIALADRSTRIVLIGIPAGIIALISLVELLQVLRRRPALVAASSTVEATRRPRVAAGVPTEARGAGS
jgi:signal peptidase